MWCIREKIGRFMRGRCGADSFNIFLLSTNIILSVFNMFINNVLISFFELVIISYMLYRFFSRNIYQRSKENNAFLKVRGKIIGFFRYHYYRYKERKINVYKKCPYCKAKLRLPRSRGKHTVKCPRCRRDFDMKIR
ncbi:MAG: hypothetical protein PHD46_02375 [Eubacteriales bacterium]|nr:hypothetical protein [Eubacteriales bacterium]MDD4421862.1 hypothetical protein [Eubacteriales bacterium]HBR32594.1 hypothetical protein [Clostridiales bacterium]